MPLGTHSCEQNVNMCAMYHAQGRKSRPHSEAIVAVLQERRQSKRPVQIRELLIDAGVAPEKLGVNNSYFYTSLKRLVEKGRLKRRDGRYRMVKQT